MAWAVLLCLCSWWRWCRGSRLWLLFLFSSVVASSLCFCHLVSLQTILCLSLSLGFPSFSLFFCFARAPLLSNKNSPLCFCFFVNLHCLLSQICCSLLYFVLLQVCFSKVLPPLVSLFFFVSAACLSSPALSFFFLPTFPSAPPPRVFIGRGGEVHHTLYKHRAWWPGHGSPVSPLMRVWVV